MKETRPVQNIKEVEKSLSNLIAFIEDLMRFSNISAELMDLKLGRSVGWTREALKAGMFSIWDLVTILQILDVEITLTDKQ